MYQLPRQIKSMNRRYQTGLTLIEVMVTLAVAAILVVVAIPSFTNMTKSNRLTSAVNDVVYSLNLARSEALKSGGASVCVSADQASCTGGDDWTQGWIVFSDLNSNCTIDAGESVIRGVDSVPPSPFKMKNVEGNTCIKYSNQGFLLPAGAVANFQFCDDREGDKAGRQINIITTGRPTTNFLPCPF